MIPPFVWISGGGLEFLPGHFYLFHKGDGKLYFFSPQAVFPPGLVAIYLFHPSFFTIFF